MERARKVEQEQDQGAEHGKDEGGDRRDKTKWLSFFVVFRKHWTGNSSCNVD
jgi:hypothetical protein